MGSFSGFSPRALEFLRELKENNTREWFQPRKEEYERELRDPLLELVGALTEGLAKFAPDHVMEPSKSIYRIYRDTRFSKNKEPYKTHVAAFFPHHELGKEESAGYYVHFGATEFVIGGGLYYAMPPKLKAIRDQIRDTWPRVETIANAKALRDLGGVTGEAVARPPRGYLATDPAVEWIKRKQFLMGSDHEAEFGLSAGLVPAVLERFRAMTAMVEFLNEALLRVRAEPIERLD